eukprot:INCI7215.4.p1 GENE.INCI7215.4~~INCI7215.4.p1  ORF type:complete len:113 (-),score=3.01 INCI7215.4:40-378(-)
MISNITFFVRAFRRPSACRRAPNNVLCLCPRVKVVCGCTVFCWSCYAFGDEDNCYIPVVMNYGDDFKYNLFCPSLSPPECLPACSKQCFVSLPPRQSRVWVYCILLELLCVW